MNRILWKDILEEIKHSLGRFFSIMAIVALGVAFFAGIKGSAPDMKASADWYFDKYNMQDIQIYSTVGLDKQDVKDIAAIKGVEQVQPVFSFDALSRHGSAEEVVKVISMESDQAMNVPVLMEGRLPDAPDECVIEASSVSNELKGEYGLGDRITLYSGTDTPISDTLDYSTFIIVGKAYNPNYISYEKGTSSVGSGSVDTFIYIDQAAVKADYYTEIDVTVEGAKKLNSYSQAYFDQVDPVLDRIEGIAQASVARHIDVAQKKVDDAKKEAGIQLDDAKLKLDKGADKLAASALQIQQGLAEIANNEAILNGSKAELEQGWNEYYANKQQVDSGLVQVNDGISQIESAQAQLPALQAQREQLNTAINLLPTLNNGLNTIDRLQARYQDLMDQLDRLQQENPDSETIPWLIDQINIARADLDQAIADFTGQPGLTVDGAIAYLHQMRDQILSQIGSVEEGKALLEQLDAAIAQIQGLQGQLDSLYQTRDQLLSAQAQLDAAYATLSAGQAQLESGASQLAAGKKQLEDGQKQLEDGQKEWEAGKKEFDEQKEKADKQLDDAQDQVNSLKDGAWIVLDRNSHYSYRDYESAAQRMDGIASVFPVFFFLVAALVCMTTMTRMVEEERTEIGTFKALGYSKGQIAFKYMAYAGVASICGSILGAAVGMVLFPAVIFYAWNIMYNLESLHFVWQPGLILMAGLSVTAIVLAATFYSIYRSLMEHPSQLMRPKAAKAGKKILLERIPWLWSRISFMHKVTLRNLFRYKKRFFMTVVGISGCSALLLTGFGINDSVSNIVPGQFEQIYHYNATVTADESQNENLKEQIAQAEHVNGCFDQQILPITVQFDGKDIGGYLNIIDDPEAFEEYMTFNSTETGTRGEQLKLDDSGVLVAVNTASKMGLNVGDTIEFETSDNRKLSAKISGIFDQYIDNQIFVTKKLYDTWNVTEKPNSVFLLVNDGTDEQTENEIGNEIMNLNGVKGITFYTATIKNFSNMIASLKLIVVVLVLSAAALAFVVLYNLANVNISERKREIATIEVLGFTEKEVNQYVNRESLIMALIGGGAGLFLGIWLHGVVMKLAELDTVRFGRYINPWSFVISIVLTMVFALMVNWIMKYQIRKIEMVESLKAVE